MSVTSEIVIHSNWAFMLPILLSFCLGLPMHTIVFSIAMPFSMYFHRCWDNSYDDCQGSWGMDGWDKADHLLSLYIISVMTLLPADLLYGNPRSIDHWCSDKKKQPSVTERIIWYMFVHLLSLGLYTIIWATQFGNLWAYFWTGLATLTVSVWYRLRCDHIDAHYFKERYSSERVIVTCLGAAMTGLGLLFYIVARIDSVDNGGNNDPNTCKTSRAVSLTMHAAWHIFIAVGCALIVGGVSRWNLPKTIWCSCCFRNKEYKEVEDQEDLEMEGEYVWSSSESESD